MAVCDITRTAIRNNQALTIHFDTAPGADSYKIYLVQGSAQLAVFTTTTTPYKTSPLPAATYEVAIEALDENGAVIDTGATETVEVPVTAQACGVVIRQQVTDILADAGLQGCYVLVDDDGRYLNISESGMVTTDVPVAAVGPAVFQASVVESSDRRIESWDLPIHVLAPGQKADVALEQVGEIVGQIVQVVTNVEYLGLEGMGLSPRPLRWVADATIDDELDATLYTLMMTVEVQRPIT